MGKKIPLQLLMALLDFNQWNWNFLSGFSYNLFPRVGLEKNPLLYTWVMWDLNTSELQVKSSESDQLLPGCEGCNTPRSDLRITPQQFASEYFCALGFVKQSSIHLQTCGLVAEALEVALRFHVTFVNVSHYLLCCCYVGCSGWSPPAPQHCRVAYSVVIRDALCLDNLYNPLGKCVFFPR